MSRVAIVAGGDAAPTEFLRHRLKASDRVVAVDRGAQYVLDAGLLPHEVIGDFDSLPSDTGDELRRRGVPCTVHPCAKDQSDLELALQHVLQAHPDQIEILCGLGGRMDHLLVNAMVLLQARRCSIPCRMTAPEVELFFLLGSAEVEGAPGDWLTLLAVSPQVVDVWTEGLRYPLRGDTLHAGSSRGLSNELLTSRATVRAGDGDLLVVHTPRSA